MLYKWQYELHCRRDISWDEDVLDVMFHFSTGWESAKQATDHNLRAKSHSELVPSPNSLCVWRCLSKAGPELLVWASQWELVGFYSILIVHFFQCFNRRHKYVKIQNLPNQQAQKILLSMKQKLKLTRTVNLLIMASVISLFYWIIRSVKKKTLLCFDDRAFTIR